MVNRQYRTEGFKDIQYFKNQYKIQFWSYEKFMSIFEEISIQRIRIKSETNVEIFLTFSIFKKYFFWIWAEFFHRRF